MPAKPLDADEARVLRLFREDTLRGWLKWSGLPMNRFWQLQFDGMLRQGPSVTRSGKVKCRLTRAGALALAAYEKEQQRG